MRTPKAQEVPKRKDGTSYGATGEELARRLLECSTRVSCAAPAPHLQSADRQPGGCRSRTDTQSSGTGYSPQGGSRSAGCTRTERTPSACPPPYAGSRLPNSRWELDDASAYMHIVSLLLPDLRVRVEAYLRSKSAIGDEVASALLPHLTARERRRDAAPQSGRCRSLPLHQPRPSFRPPRPSA